ncbi:hypothetical protein [Pedobacter nanyangensis]|uniref:hypothetical protein n=1 Tax=Pedobacter nanyangensis TaxID=1562389 RepID=UPI000DE1C7E6|nr:hypothetical protein [Pedobacter nanyangensis]
MKRNPSRLQELAKRYLAHTISKNELHELFDYANDPLFTLEIKDKLASLFEQLEPQALQEEQQKAILDNIFNARKP